MDAAGTGRTGGAPQRVAAGAPSAEAAAPGRITVKERVFVKVAEEATSTSLGIDRGQVSVDIAEAQGGLAVTIGAPLPVPDLDDTDAIRSGKTVLERVATIQSQLRDRIAEVTGRDVHRVNITITGAVMAEKKRVK